MRSKRSPWFKVFAVCTAVGLAGTYVWRQQQGADSKQEKPVEPAELTGKSNVSKPLPTGPEFNDSLFHSAQDRIFMPSSKVGIVAPKSEQKHERVLMPGSKSLTMPAWKAAPKDPLAKPKADEP